MQSTQNSIVREITISVVSGAIGAVLMFLASASFGLLEAGIEDTQVRRVADEIVNDSARREVLINKMASDQEQRFRGPQGPKGETGATGESGVQGEQGPQGFSIGFDANLGGDGALIFTADNGYVIHWTREGWFCMYVPEQKCYDVGARR